jgi:hypothetical protein
MSELERALVLIGRELDVPDAPDVVAAVLDRLEPTRARRPRQRQRRLALAVAFVVLAAVTATLAVPDARSALFRVLHLGGERIEFVDELPVVSADPVELEIVLGERVSLTEARRRAGFELRELEQAPDRVYLGARGTVWFLYGAPDTVRLLVAQTPRLRVDEFIFKKLVGGETRLEQVVVDGSRGVFLSGGPHLVMLLDERGEVVEESTRLARNVLLWEQDGVALRLEGDFSKNQAVDLAESLR